MRLTLRGSGSNENVEGQIDAALKALRVALRPLDWVKGDVQGPGHFYFEAATGALTGVGANGPIASLRWTDAARVLVLLRASLVYYLTTAYTTAQMNDFELIRATGFTASDTGGNVVTPQAKSNLNMSKSLVADCRLASTAALGAGTRTIDGAGIRVVADGPPNVAIPTATLAIPRQELLLYDLKEAGDHPLVLGPNEGLLLRMLTAMGAVGVIKAYLAMEWVEAPLGVL